MTSIVSFFTDTMLLNEFSLYQILAYFLIYSCLGWCVEVIYAAVTTGELVNRGFLNGPVCPIYGFGMILVLFALTPLEHSVLLLYIGGVILPSALELVGGWALYKIYHTRWWDYHDMKFNIHGRICLETMLPFGLLGTFALYRINPFLMMLFHRIPGYVSGKLVTGVVVLFLADLVISVCVLRNLSLPDGDADHTAEISRRVWEDLKKRLG